MSFNEPEVRQLPERLVACIEYTGNYIGDTALFERLFTQLGAWAASKDLMSAQTMFMSSYANDPRTTALDELRLDVCMSIADDTDVEGNVQRKVLPGGNYAVLHAEIADAKGFETAWNALVEWAEQNGHASDYTRPSYEFYLNNPQEHPQKHHIVDLCLSVNVFA